MIKRHEIQVLLRAGHSFTKVAELSGASRRTVARVARENPVVHIDDDVERRKRRVGRPSKVERFRRLIGDALEGRPDLPSIEILRRARAEGYSGGKSAFFVAVRELRPPKLDFVTRFEAVPGEFSQHDFGEVVVTYLDGGKERLRFFATRLKYSRWAQVSLVTDQRAETLVRTTCEHFDALGGIPLMAVFDRPKTVAQEWKKDGTITKYNPVFAQAMFDMGVGVEVCWPYSPRQKGAVENLVGWVKGSFFKVRRFQDRADVEAQLADWHHDANEVRPSRATGVPPESRMVVERARLRPLKVKPANLAIRRPFRVGPTAMVSLDGSLYSMTPEAANYTGTAFIYQDWIRFEAGRFSAEHARASGSGMRSVLPEHRAARLAAVSGRRGKQYLKRQDILDLGDIAVVFVSELVHRQPRRWSEQIDRLHDLLQTCGDGLLTLAIHMAVAQRRFTVDAVHKHLVHHRAGRAGAASC